MTSRAFTHSLRKYRLSRRALIFVSATLFLHLFALQSAKWSDWSINSQPSTEKIVHIQLHAEPRSIESAVPKAVSDQTIAQPKAKQKTTALPAETQDPAAPILNPPVETAAATPSIDDKLAETIVAESATPDAQQEVLPSLATAKYAVRAPESVRIEMALVRTKPDATQNHGVGSLTWTVKDGRYSMSIEAGLDLLITSFNLYKMTSEGRLDQFGITPEMSTEARRTRASTATHFHHDDKTISFSSSSKIVPMDDGAQDKASFLMQLAAIGYADEKQIFAGKEIELQVAEEKDAALFHFLVIGKEEITTKLGKIPTWHLLRAPKPGTYNSQLDIWLAPALGWYPVQIRNTEKNGTVTEQTVTKLTQKINQES